MSKTQVKGFVEDTRHELGATLDEIEHRMRPDVVAKKFVAWVSRSYDEDSTPWLIGLAVAGVTAVAAVLWAIFGDD